MAAARTGARIVGRMYAQRASAAYAARVRREPLARLGRPPYEGNPYPLYDLIRARGPISPTPLGNLVTASHGVGSEVVRSRTFRAFNAQQSAEDPTPRELLDLSLLEMNPPEHTRLRRLVAPAFTPRRMAAYERLVEARVSSLLDGVDARAGFDLVRDFATPLPIAVITELLGVEGVDGDVLAGYGSTLATALDGVHSVGQLRRLAQTQRQLRELFATLFARRASDPGDDIVSALLAAEDDQITTAELAALCRLLLVAGFETTVNAIGNGVRALLADPEQWQLLVGDPSRAPAVVEEVLRYDTAVQITARLASADTELAGVPVRSGQAVVVLLGGANRDPAAYPEPNVFDITRTPAVDHLAFSGGVHYCLGAALARLELAVAFRVLAERLPGLRLAGPVVMRRGATILGAERMPVRA